MDDKEKDREECICLGKSVCGGCWETCPAYYGTKFFEDDDDQ